MSDRLIQLGKSLVIRNLFKNFGLPNLPQELKRSKHPWEQHPLKDQVIITGQIRSSKLTEAIAGTVARLGATALVDGDETIFNIFHKIGSGYGRLPHYLSDEDKPVNPFQAMIYDATDIQRPEELNLVFSFFHDHLRSLSTCGRAVIIARPPETMPDIASATSSRSLEGFIRALSREVGFNGSTANIIYVSPDAEDRLESVMRFILSPRSAYITGQPLNISNQVLMNEPSASIRPLDRKIAMVTGSAQGIGAAIARTMAREGAKVIIVDRPCEEISAAKLASEIQGTLLLCDITDASAGNTMLELISNKFKGLDILVHNAGITRDKLLVNMKSEIWDQVLDVNLRSILRVNEKILPVMREGGRMVCLSSVSGIAGNRGQTNYSTSKAGVIGYVQHLASDVKERGIAVNAVAPGFIETQMTARIPFATREVARRLSNLNQGGQPEDVAETVTFLSSPGASGLSGQVIRICGGALIGA
jgi:3-oxoacyl-[acyl-carrier protein] reductase